MTTQDTLDNIPSIDAVEKMMNTTGGRSEWLELPVGGKVVGKIIEKKMANIKGQERLLYVIQVADGKTYALKNRTSLYTKLEEQAAEVGKLVYIRYDGEKSSQTRKGAMYHSYAVKVFTNEDLV